MATPQQKVFCVLEFAKTDAIVTVQRAFRTEFGIDLPHRESIRRWVTQFKETGCLCKGKSPGRPRVSEEQVEKIHDAFNSEGLRNHSGEIDTQSNLDNSSIK